MPLLSFVIPVRNDVDRLRRCLSSIRSLRYPRNEVEVIVADNGSSDGSGAAARDAGATVLTLPGLRVAALRNTAAGAASGTILAFVDADHEIDGDWAACAVDTLRLPNVAAVGAPYDRPANGTWVQRQYDRLRSRTPGLSDTAWLASGNLAIWKREFDELGGFDTRLETCEDVDLCVRLRASGRRLMSDDRLRSVHHGDPATLAELFRGELWRGRDNVAVTLRKPRSAQSVLGLALTVLLLPCLALAGVGLLGISRWGPAPAVTGLAGVLALTAIQTLRMWQRQPVTAADLLQTPLVAGVYVSARALALVTHASHRFRHQPPQR